MAISALPAGEPQRPGVRLDTVPAGTLHRPGADRLEEALHTIPGATADTAFGGLATAIRRRGFQVTRTRYGALPDIQRLFVRDPATAEAVELVAGPSALLDGVTDPGGVIRYQPLRPRFTEHTELRLATGSHHHRRLVADHTAPVGQNVAYRATLAAQDGETDPGDFTTRRIHGRLAATWRYAPGARVRLAHERQENRRPYLFGTVIPTDGIQYDRVYADPRQHADRDYARTALHWSARVRPGVTLRADLARTDVDRDERMAGFLALCGDLKWCDDQELVAGYFTDYRDRARQTDGRLEVRLEGEAAGWKGRGTIGLTRHQRRHRFTGEQAWGNTDPEYGPVNSSYFFDVDNPDWRSVDLDALETVGRFDRARRVETGGHAAATFTGHGWRLGAGLRHTRYRIRLAEEAGSALTTRAREEGVTGRAGAERRLGERWTLRTTAATGLRPSEGQDVDGDYLPPRRSRMVEAGVRWQPVQGAELDLARYRLEERNRPREVDGHPDGALEAVGRVAVEGTELSARWHGQGCHLQLAAARNDARNRTDGAEYEDKRPVGVPTASAGLTTNCRLATPEPLPDRLGWRTRWQGHRWADPANTRRVHAHTVHGLTAGWDLTPHQSLTLDAVNLTDRDHIRSVTSTSNIYQGPTRRLFLGWRASL